MGYNSTKNTRLSFCITVGAGDRSEWISHNMTHIYSNHFLFLSSTCLSQREPRIQIHGFLVGRTRHDDVDGIAQKKVQTINQNHPKPNFASEKLGILGDPPAQYAHMVPVADPRIYN